MEMRNNMKTSLSAAAVAEEEARHLLGVGPAVGSPEPGAAAKPPKARRPRRTRPAASSRRSCGWPSLFAFFAREEPDPIPVGKPLNAQQLKQLREERFRATQLGHFEELAIHRRFVMKCLKYYNSMHPSDEYEPAPGEVIKYFGSRDGIPVTHGNFVARRKRSGCFSFLPAPRTLFFVELMWKDGRERVVKCTPLDEPVTEGYSILGFRIWWGTRRDGSCDCICKSCHRRFEFGVYEDLRSKTLACGHNKAERVCDMCYPRSIVLHPFP